MTLTRLTLTRLTPDPAGPGPGGGHRVHASPRAHRSQAA